MPKVERCSEQLSTRASAELMYILERKIRLEDHAVRMGEVLALRSELGKRDWFKLLGRVWVACAGYNSHPFKDQLRQALREAGEARFEMMETEDCEALAELPEAFPVYRGCQYPFAVDGLSWSLKESIAEMYPPEHYRRHDSDSCPIVITGIARRDASVLKLDNCEFEIVCPDVEIRSVRRVLNEDERVDIAISQAVGLLMDQTKPPKQ